MSAYQEEKRFLFTVNDYPWVIDRTWVSGSYYLRVVETITDDEETYSALGVFKYEFNEWVHAQEFYEYSSRETCQEVVDYLNANDPVNEPWWQDFLTTEPSHY